MHCTTAPTNGCSQHNRAKNAKSFLNNLIMLNLICAAPFICTKIFLLTQVEGYIFLPDNTCCRRSIIFLYRDLQMMYFVWIIRCSSSALLISLNSVQLLSCIRGVSVWDRQLPVSASPYAWIRSVSSSTNVKSQFCSTNKANPHVLNNFSHIRCFQCIYSCFDTWPEFCWVRELWFVHVSVILSQARTYYLSVDYLIQQAANRDVIGPVPLTHKINVKY